MKIFTRCHRSAAAGRYGISRTPTGPILWLARTPQKSKVRTRTRLAFLLSSFPKLGSLQFSCSRICISTPGHNPVPDRGNLLWGGRWFLAFAFSRAVLLFGDPRLPWAYDIAAPCLVGSRSQTGSGV